MEPEHNIPNEKRLSFKLWNRKRDFKILKFIAISIIVIASLIIIKDEISWQIDSALYEENEFASDSTIDEMDCNVIGIELHGELVTYIPPIDENNDSDAASTDQTTSEKIVFVIQDAETDDSIKAIILEVDSYGGYPVAAEEIANALKQASKPTVALIREGGVSVAYWAATGADVIFASKNSDVGSIAVTSSYLDYTGQNQKEGITYVPLSSGKFKDTGDPDRPLSWEERNLLMSNINILHQNFVATVAENRNLEVSAVEKLADGSTMLGEMALENGLIDYIGGMPEVNEYLKEQIGGDVEICWY